VVAVDPQDQPVAFIGLGAEPLEALFVHPQHRGKGIGRTLVSFAATLHPVLDTILQAIDLVWRQIVSRFDPDAFQVH
jgi:putative acetyltransferase